MSNPTSEFVLFSATTLMGFGLGGAGMATMVSIAGKVAPVNKRSLAMGLVAAAASFGQFAVVLPTMWINKEFGWEVSLVVLASISISLLLLLPLLNSTNEKNNEVATQTLREKKNFVIDTIYPNLDEGHSTIEKKTLEKNFFEVIY